MASYLIHIFLLIFILSGCNHSVGIGGDYAYRLRRAPDENCRYLKRQISNNVDMEDADDVMSVDLYEGNEPEDLTSTPKAVDLKEKKPNSALKLAKKAKPLAKKKADNPVKPSCAPSLSEVPQKKYSPSKAKNILAEKKNEEVDLIKKSEALQPITPPAPTPSKEIKNELDKEMVDMPQEKATISTQPAPQTSPKLLPEMATSQPKPTELIPPATPKVEVKPEPKEPKPAEQPSSATNRGNLRYKIEEKPLPRLPS